jgi:hypothetical protein
MRSGVVLYRTVARPTNIISFDHSQFLYNIPHGQFLGMPEDNWIHRSEKMRCKTCMAFVEKKTKKQTTRKIGRCRMHAPTMKGFPVVFEDDWCLDHKIDEETWAAANLLTLTGDMVDKTNNMKVQGY